MATKQGRKLEKGSIFLRECGRTSQKSILKYTNLFFGVLTWGSKDTITRMKSELRKMYCLLLNGRLPSFPLYPHPHHPSKASTSLPSSSSFVLDQLFDPGDRLLILLLLRRRRPPSFSPPSSYNPSSPPSPSSSSSTTITTTSSSCFLRCCCSSSPLSCSCSCSCS